MASFIAAQIHYRTKKNPRYPPLGTNFYPAPFPIVRRASRKSVTTEHKAGTKAFQNQITLLRMPRQFRIGGISAGIEFPKESAESEPREIKFEFPGNRKAQRFFIFHTELAHGPC